MSPSKTIVQAMKFDREYTHQELAAMTNMRLDLVEETTALLVRAGVIDRVCRETGKLTKPSAATYATRQRELKLLGE